MADPIVLDGLVPDSVFDGGDLDCGSGLVLLIREAMKGVPPGGVLEMRSCESTVRDDLPPWCRMVGHEYLGAIDGAKCTRYFVRRGTASPDDAAALEQDKKRADAYQWRLRVRASGGLKSTVYCRNFSFDAGQPLSFEDKDAHPSAIEYLLGALGAALASGFATECSRSGLSVDDVELTVKGRLRNALAHLGIGEADPSLAGIEVKCFASTFEDEARVRQAWERTVALSPVAATLAHATEIAYRLSIV